ncbi:MAG TPA: hypothetical protein VGI81_26865 [Tepidisphaeraceae bacterium]
MPSRFRSDPLISHRRALSAGASLAVGYSGPLDPSLGAEPARQQPQHPPANGGTDPFPIPWLDKNGSHNQPAGPNMEPSHVFHFKGKVGRCAGFVGMGTDGQGNRVPFGLRTTDYGFMDGEYWAGRTAHRAVLTHI